MRVRSVNVGIPRTVTRKRQPVTTGIFKSPVAGDVYVRRLNLEGDQQADLRVHGGEAKAVYAYPWEHYAVWQRAMPDVQFTPGAFGENLTVEGLVEDEVEIGDQFEIGTALLTVTQPRSPCYKLGIRFGRDDVIRRFVRLRRPGMYFRVEREGTLGAGSTITRLAQSGSGVTVTAMFDMMMRRG
jgi:MOSC domain-containing protein YiiM